MRSADVGPAGELQRIFFFAFMDSRVAVMDQKDKTSYAAHLSSQRYNFEPLSESAVLIRYDDVSVRQT